MVAKFSHGVNFWVRCASGNVLAAVGEGATTWNLIIRTSGLVAFADVSQFPRGAYCVLHTGILRSAAPTLWGRSNCILEQLSPSFAEYKIYFPILEILITSPLGC